MSALMLELAKSLKLVAPISMSADAQLVWLQAAVDALDGIHAHEVAAISAELRRSVTRPSQIVPEIAKLVDEKRKRSHHAATSASPFAAEMAINRESNERRAKAHGSAVKLEEAFEWERQARSAAGLHVPLRAPPLSREELDNLPPAMVKMGLTGGFLKRDGDRIVEVRSAGETDRIREAARLLAPGSKPNGRDHEDGLDAQHESRISAQNTR